MRTKRFRQTENDGTYDLSISDLMAALCCIFILVTISIVTSLKQKNFRAEEYSTMQENIFLNLKNEFSEDELKDWGAYIDEDTLSIRFTGAKVSFKDYDDQIPYEYKKILDTFFPRLIKIIRDKNYIDEIEEIRIEGHTAPASGVNPKTGKKYQEGDDEDWSTGIDLSQRRTANVLNYCLDNFTASKEEREWVKKHIVANGYSFSKPLGTDKKLIKEDRNLSKEEKASSRRVEFRIKTNSDKIVQQFQNKKAEE